MKIIKGSPIDATGVISNGIFWIINDEVKLSGVHAQHGKNGATSTVKLSTVAGTLINTNLVPSIEIAVSSFNWITLSKACIPMMFGKGNPWKGPIVNWLQFKPVRSVVITNGVNKPV